MPTSKLLTTDKSLIGLAPAAARYAVRDSLIPGLEIRVSPSGVRTWVLRYYAAGQRRRVKLGVYPRLSLHAARKAASAALRSVDGGGDPQAEKLAAKAAAVAEKAAAERAKRDSIEALTADYIERHAKPRKRTWAADAHKVNRVIIPAWRGRPVSTITRRDCRELVQAIADRGAPIQANRVAALLSRLFRYAVDQELVEHNVAAKLPKPGVEIAARPEPEREVKPYDDDRFFSSLSKAKKHMDMRMNSKLTGKLMDLMREHLHAKSEYTEQFIIKERGREIKVPVDDILFLRAEGNYLHLQLKEKHHLYRMTMNAVETELDPTRFLRIHRSYIVHNTHIRNVRYSGNNEFVFLMANGERIVSGRSYREQIAKALQEQTV
jgi:DNA-binding LytR/AlgR family response regulator